MVTFLTQTIATTAPTTVPPTVPTTLPDPTAVTEGGLDITSIKELMDGFDPASLLPELSDIFSSLASLCRFAVMAGPVVLLVLGLAYLFLAPKEANYYFGYRCYFGMGSVNAWRFTQRLAGLVLTGLGLILTIVMYVLSGSFAAMEVTDMVWKAFDCLVWEAALTLIATLGINGAAAWFFDRKGEYRKGRRKAAAKKASARKAPKKAPSVKEETPAEPDILDIVDALTAEDTPDGDS